MRPSFGFIIGLVLLMSVVPDLGMAQTTTRVSVSSAGGEGDDQSYDPSLSWDGRFVAFASRSTNLVLGDTNFSRDIFVHDRQTGQTSRVSVSSTGQQADNASYDPQLSADGRFVAFWSYAKNLVVGDTNGREDFFVHDRQTGQTTRVNVSSAGAEAGPPTKITGVIGVALSADGGFVAFDSCSTNLVLGDTNDQCDIFVHDRQTGQTSRVSVSSTGEQANGDSTRPQLSADGRFVAFISEASNLVAADTNNDWDVYVHDRQTGQTTRVNVTTIGVESNGIGSPDTRISLSGDGRVVAFDACGSNLFPADPNGGCDIFVHDRQAGQTSWVSVSSTGEPANDSSFYPQLSANGRFVTFNSLASNLVSGDTNATIFSLDFDTFVHDRQTGQTTRVSVSSAGIQAAPSDCECIEPAISGNGRFIAFTSDASNLVPGDTNTAGQFSEGGDIFVHDRGPMPRRNTDGGDFNGDGNEDLVWRDTGTGVVAMWFLNGTTLTSSGFPAGVPLEWKIVGFGDVNDDGKADVIWRHITGVIAVWLMDGATIIGVGFPAGISPEWIIQAVEDVDGNGTADLVWRNTATGAGAVWLMNGGTIASSGFLPSVSLIWEMVGVGDADNDGKADIIWHNTVTGEIVVWVMNGLSMTGTISPGSKPIDWEVGGIGDVDGNGTADVVWVNPVTEEMEVWFLDGTGLVSSTVFAGKSADWVIAKVGDTNGDGKADLVWQNTSTGEVEVWQMDGSNQPVTGSPGNAGPPWELQ